MTTTDCPPDSPYGNNPNSPNASHDDTSDSVELDRHGADLVDSLAQARAAIKAWQDIEHDTKAKLAALIGDHKYGKVLGERRVTVVRTVPNRFDQKAFRADHPRLHDEYVRPSSPVTTVLLSSE